MKFRFMECKDRKNRTSVMLSYTFLPSMPAKKLRDAANKVLFIALFVYSGWLIFYKWIRSVFLLIFLHLLLMFYMLRDLSFLLNASDVPSCFIQSFSYTWLNYCTIMYQKWEQLLLTKPWHCVNAWLSFETCTNFCNLVLFWCCIHKVKYITSTLQVHISVYLVYCTFLCQVIKVMC